MKIWKICQLPILSPLHNFLDFNIYFEGSAHNIMTHIIYSAIRLTFLISNLNFKDFYSLTVIQSYFLDQKPFLLASAELSKRWKFLKNRDAVGWKSIPSMILLFRQFFKNSFQYRRIAFNKPFFNSSQDSRIVKHFNLHNQKWKITVSQGL